MHCNAELKRFADCRCFHACTYATPKRRVQQYDVNRSVQDVRRELFEVNDNGVRCEWHTDFLTHAAHSVHTKRRIFKIIVSNVFDLLTKPDRRLGGPHSIRIKTEAIVRQRRCKSAITFQFVLRRKYSAFELV